MWKEQSILKHRRPSYNHLEAELMRQGPPFGRLEPSVAVLRRPQEKERVGGRWMSGPLMSIRGN